MSVLDFRHKFQQFANVESVASEYINDWFKNTHYLHMQYIRIQRYLLEMMSLTIQMVALQQLFKFWPRFK